jgi:hypothetical protein
MSPMNKPELVERVRDFIYDCTKDEFDSGWTLSAHQTDDIIEMVSQSLGVERLVAALERCRDKFSEYAEGHALKMHQAIRSGDKFNYTEKAVLNQRMVKLCDEALSSLSQNTSGALND